MYVVNGLSWKIQSKCRTTLTLKGPYWGFEGYCKVLRNSERCGVMMREGNHTYEYKYIHKYLGRYSDVVKALLTLNELDEENKGLHLLHFYIHIQI